MNRPFFRVCPGARCSLFCSWAHKICWQKAQFTLLIWLVIFYPSPSAEDLDVTSVPLSFCRCHFFKWIIRCLNRHVKLFKHTRLKSIKHAVPGDFFVCRFILANSFIVWHNHVQSLGMPSSEAQLYTDSFIGKNSTFSPCSVFLPGFLKSWKSPECSVQKNHQFSFAFEFF